MKGHPYFLKLGYPERENLTHHDVLYKAIVAFLSAPVVSLWFASRFSFHPALVSIYVYPHSDESIIPVRGLFLCISTSAYIYEIGGNGARSGRRAVPADALIISEKVAMAMN